MVPVATIARQTRGLDAEHAADFTGAYFAHQSLKSGALDAPVPRAAEIFVDHGNVAEAEFPSATDQAVLSELALLVPKNLAR